MTAKRGVDNEDEARREEILADIDEAVYELRISDAIDWLQDLAHDVHVRVQALKEEL